MADLEQLSISIESDSHKAEEAINSLIRGLENLNNALGSLDVNKISSFASAVSKLSNIGNNTNTTAKALKTMANDISSLYGVKSKKGVQEITQAVQELYKAQGEALKQNSREADNNYADKYGNLEQAIKDNYQYRQELDDTTKKVVDFIATQKELGTKIGFAGFKDNYNAEQFKALNKAFSGMLDPKHFGYEEGFTQLENFLDLLSSKTGAQISDNSFGGLEDIKVIIDDAKNSVWDFAKAFSEGEHTARGLDEAVSDVAGKIYDLVNAKSQNIGRTGLEGVADFFQTIQMVKMPDLSGMTQAIKDIGANPPKETARAVEDIEESAEKASKYFYEIYQNVGRIGTTKEMPLALPQWDKMLPAVVKDGREYMAKAHKKLFDSDMKRTWETIDFTPKVEPVLALPQFDKMLPAVVQAQDATRGLFQSIEEVVNEQPKVDAVTSSFNEWKSSLLETARAAEKTGAQFEKWSVPEQGINPSFNREALGFVSDIKPNAGEDYFYKIQESAQKCLPAIRDVGTTALALPDQFKSFEQATKQAFDSIKSSAKNTVESFSDFHFPDLGTGLPEETFKGVEQGARQASSAIKQAFEDMRRFKEILSNMESGKMPFFEDMYIKYTKGYDEAAKKVDDFKKSISGGGEKPTAMADVLENVEKLGNALGELSEKFGDIAEKGIGLFKFLTKPLQMAAGEYVEKFENMGKTVENFQKNFKAHMAKIQQFWKRTMKTFTFMLVRKAITAIIKEVNNAIQSMAKFSDAMGTQFNNSISVLVADFQYLGRSIVSVFAPLINFIAPIIDAIVDRIALLLSYIGMLMAALTGASSFTKAKKNVGNYAKSLDGASKSAKNLTMGIDELNILAENSGGGSAKPYDGWEDAWEEVEIPDWIKDLGDWLKDLFHKFFDPLKEAWDRAKQYVIDGFKTMIIALKRLFSDIGRDFLEMWNQEKTIRMFEEIFRIVGDIFRVVRNLANGFDDAWNRGRVGLHIFENLRDIAYELVQHVRNVSYYMIDWAKNINFSPLLESFEKMTRKMVDLADFVGGVLEDIMINGVLKYIQFMIEDAIPHLQHTITEVLETFSFNDLREKLKPVWGAVEELLENIHTGVTNALGNLGKEIARFTGSQEFADFLQRIVDVTKLITQERVEKVLTGVGKGILSIGKAIVKFVNSKPFIKFLEAIGKWIDNKSVDQIAKVLENIANAILVFKFAEFTTSKLSGFFKFFTIIKSLTNLGSIATSLTKLAGATTEAGAGATALATGASKLEGVAGIFGAVGKGIGGIVGSIAEFKASENYFEKLAEGAGILNDGLFGLVTTTGIVGAAFTALFGFPAGLIATLLAGVVGAIKGLSDGFEQVQLDHIFDGVLAKGELTIQQVKEWYGEITDTVGEHIDKWKSAERNLTQDRGDLEEYTRDLKEFSSVFESGAHATASMADDLVQKYENLKSSIDNYINQSTDALVSNILAQKGFLEAQNIDVDQMIVDIYRSADANKKAVDDSVQGIKEAVDGLDGLTEGTAEFNDQMQKVADATSKASEAVQPYIDTFNNIDMSGAISEIERLGNSLDLSQYNGDWEAAGTDIINHIQDVTAKYTEQMGELKTEADRLKEEIDLMPNVSDSAKEAAKLSIDQSYNEVSTELSDKTKEVFDFYATSLSTHMEGVATQAHEDWQTFNPLKKLWYGSEDNYILHEMELYSEKMLGQEGLAGAFSKGFAALPDEVDPQVVESMQGIVENQRKAFEESMFNTEESLKGAQVDTYNNVLKEIGSLDFDTPAKDFATKSFTAVESNLNQVEYDKLGQLFVGKSGSAILDNSHLFEDSNRLVANDGAAAFSQEYRDYLSDNQEMITAMENIGDSYGKPLIDGLNTSISENMETTTPYINDWFNLINQAIHDNPFAPYGSPNLKTKEYGNDLVEGLNLGIDESSGSTEMSVSGWFSKIISFIDSKVAEIKSKFATMMVDILSANGIDVVTPITTLFANVTAAITNNINLLGANLVGTILPTFIQTYLLPFFGLERWQPLFDNLMNTVFIPLFEIFRTWFTEEAMTVWWNEDLLFWFSADKWNEDIFTPLHELFQENWDTFSGWWDTSMTAWWENQVKVWFSEEIWKEQFNHVLTVAEKVFELIKDAIKKRIEEAQKAVEDACEEMKNAIEEIMTAIDELIEKVGSLGGLGGTFSFNFGGKFANGGFPTEGSLFLAGEAGAEFVTNVGGRTGVVSNGEITGIADAVYSTGNQESTLLSELISVGRQMLDKDPVVIGDKDIARMANSGQSKLGMSIIS